MYTLFFKFLIIFIIVLIIYIMFNNLNEYFTSPNVNCKDFHNYNNFLQIDNTNKTLSLYL